MRFRKSCQAATVFTRTGGLWAGVLVDGDADLPMPEINVAVPPAEIYEDVEFPPDPEE